MKKLLCVLLLTVMTLTSCGNVATTGSTQLTGPPSMNTQPAYRAVGFDTFDELNEFFSEINDDISAIGNEYFQTFFKSVNEKTLSLMIPYYNNEKITLRNRDGYSNITLFPQELYLFPWIWFHCTVEDYYVTIKTTYPENLSLREDELSASQFIKQIFPDAPNVDTFESHENYKSVYEKELKLKDKNVTAMIAEVKNDERITAFFIYDDMLVIITAKAEFINGSYLENLNFN